MFCSSGAGTFYNPPETADLQPKIQPGFFKLLPASALKREPAGSDKVSHEKENLKNSSKSNKNRQVHSKSDNGFSPNSLDADKLCLGKEKVLTVSNKNNQLSNIGVVPSLVSGKKTKRRPIKLIKIDPKRRKLQEAETSINNIDKVITERHSKLSLFEQLDSGSMSFYS